MIVLTLKEHIYNIDMEEGQHHPAYTLGFILTIIVFGVIEATCTWLCFNMLSNIIDISPISFTTAIIFVVIFKIVEWVKETTLDLCFN